MLSAIIAATIAAIGLVVAIIVGWDKIRALWLRPDVRVLVFAFDRTYTLEELRGAFPVRCRMTLHPLYSSTGRDVKNATTPFLYGPWPYPPFTVRFAVLIENTGAAPVGDVTISLCFRCGSRRGEAREVEIAHPDRLAVIGGAQEGSSFVIVRAISLLPKEKQEFKALSHPCDTLYVDARDRFGRRLRNVFVWQVLMEANASPLPMRAERRGVLE